MVWHEEGCIMYKIFLVNFWVIILRLVFVHYNLKLKTFFSKNLGFSRPDVNYNCHKVFKNLLFCHKYKLGQI